MAKIVSMSSGAIDPIAQSKRVFFRPAAADTVRVGDLVCYNWDSVTDHKERTSDPTHIGLRQDTYAQGAQDFTGKLFIVEKPTEENIQFFAGVVKALGPKAGADNDMIEIWIPNGAVLPVMSDQNCVEGRTIVCVRDGVYEGSFPSNDSRPIGIAMETEDQSAADGLVWTKVDPSMFIWQASNADALLVDDETDAWTQVNKIQLEYAGDQWLEALNIELEFLAGGTGEGIALIAQLTHGQTTPSGSSAAFAANMIVGDGFGSVAAGTGSLEAATFKVQAGAAATLSGVDVACIKLESYINAAAPADLHSMIRLNCSVGGSGPDVFIHSQSAKAIAFFYNNTHGETAKVGAIKMHLAGTADETCYLWVYNDVS